jgi:ribonuclease Z
MLLQAPTEPSVELYGPAGLRSFVRHCLQSTRTRTADKYVVHELLTTEDTITSCNEDVLHGSEAVGRDILADADGFWQNVVSGSGYRTSLTVDAGAIIHRGNSLFIIFWIILD